MQSEHLKQIIERKLENSIADVRNHVPGYLFALVFVFRSPPVTLLGRVSRVRVRLGLAPSNFRRGSRDTSSFIIDSFDQGPAMDALNHRARPISSLIIIFAAFKTFLLSVALAATVGPDYDTSTSLFFTLLYPNATPSALAQRLTRWDALYFIHASTSGKMYEQEWAFGWGFSGLVSMLSPNGGGALQPLVAIALANLSHLGSVLALYKLTNLVSKDGRLAFVASVLHVISPAGLFLSAPYAESTFSCLSFTGNWMFALSHTHRSAVLKRAVLIIASGIVFGVSTVFRSNGLGSGMLFAVEAIRIFVAVIQKPSLSKFTLLSSTVLGGLCIAVGAAAPQYAAWVRYCGADVRRPWCSNTIPSIFSFVQEHYW